MICVLEGSSVYPSAACAASPAEPPVADPPKAAAACPNQGCSLSEDMCMRGRRKPTISFLAMRMMLDGLWFDWQNRTAQRSRRLKSIDFGGGNAGLSFGCTL
jgi:hypothetical protein